ncbi:tyrosine-type recombinase/integrase [Catenulispora rubra]|uniref:tyrosine-type recombinase/integrase n=1 Tax=Catenulispora rubra TaxID=280293 RepID=UPI0018922C3A|nr:tyrosine-type recombinase/integrase [Catenulispora rubra]
MPQKPQASPAAAASIEAWTERVITEREVSKSRARQLRWVAGELALVRNHEDFPFRDAANAADLLQPGPITAYLDLAARGELRRRAKAGDAHATTASMRIRADCLKILGEHAGILVAVADRPGLPELRETVDGPSRSQLRDYLARRAETAGAPAARVRLFALIGVELDTGARVGELAALTLADLADDLSTLRVVRRPQARTVSEAVHDTVKLSDGTRAALKAWLEVRETLVQPLNGSPKALWVSVMPNHAGRLNVEGEAIRRPPGMPLMPRGMQRAYTRAVVEANMNLAGSPGWIPLPVRFEQLRRAVTDRRRRRREDDIELDHDENIEG